MRSQPKSIINHQGFTLIEMFIAIVVGMLVLTGVLQVFLNARSAYYLQNAYTEIQENARFLDEYLPRIIRLTAFRSPPSPTQMSNFTPISTLFGSTAPYITGTANSGLNGSDTLTIRYQGSGNGTGTPDGTIVDCLNFGVDSNTIVTNTFSLSANSELQCQSQNPNAANTNNTQVLISGVENFQVLFGEDTNGDNQPDRYVPANYPYITMSNVVSVRLSILLRSSQQVSPYSSSSTYYMLGSTYTTPNDKYVRSLMTFTIVLRNTLANPY